MDNGNEAKKNFLKYLSPADIVTQVMLLLLTFIMLFHISEIQYWYIFIPVNIFLIIAVYKIVNSYEAKPDSVNPDPYKKFSLLKVTRYWYGVAAIVYIFKQVYVITYSLKPADWDLKFIKLDFMLFGLNPTQWAYRFEHPLLTEFLQIVYVYYYPMIIVIGLQLYLKHRYPEFKYTIFILFFSFYFSYLLYLVFPANGPRFHLHDFFSISKELPGIFFTEHIRAFLNFGESIPAGVTNPQDYVQRDAMPSLHIITAFLVMYISWKIRSKSFYFYLPYFFCMIAATIYLRYHYFVDILGGLVVCGITIFIGNFVFRDKALSGD